MTSLNLAKWNMVQKSCKFIHSVIQPKPQPLSKSNLPYIAMKFIQNKIASFFFFKYSSLVGVLTSWSPIPVLALINLFIHNYPLTATPPEKKLNCVPNNQVKPLLLLKISPQKNDVKLTLDFFHTSKDGEQKQVLVRVYS